ncbi:motility associated factor glycosyltransferase family protein [bacterium]|nr:motility associated factor glycosyltransferase family protein [bacterium]
MFKKNIECLEKVNKTLAEKIKNTSLDKVSESVGAIKNEQGEYILVQNQKYVDDTPSPVEAAKEIYTDSIRNATTRHDFIVIFGLGLGNLLDYTHEKSICNLILYEPDLEILRFTFEYVDLSRYFTDGRLYVTDSIQECTKYIENKYLLDDKIEFVYIKNYLMQHSSEFTVLTERIYDVCNSKIIDMNTTQKMSKSWVKNEIFNVSSPKTNYPINILKNKFKDKTALILGAGPSLKDNIENIKKYRDKFVIFAVHRTLKTLTDNGIIPDFCVIVDAKWLKYYITPENTFLNNINLIADIKADRYIQNLPSKNLFIYYSENNIIGEKISSRISDKVELLETGGTSTICAYRCAKYLGFKTLIFAGIDLAFKDDTVYCDGQIAAANNQNSVKIQNILRETTQVKSVTGEYVQTRADYASFIKQFELIFAKDKNVKLYNLTTFGAYISGMIYKSFEEIISSTNIETLNADEIIEHAKTENTELPDKIRKLTQQILLEEKNKIKPIADLINEWFEMYENHPSFFEYATNIITKITSTMILQDCIQIELIKFSKLVVSKNTEEKKEFLLNLFDIILKHYKNLDNLI